MTTQTFSLPDLGVELAEVTEIMVSVGDMIAENDDVVLLESDKASMEVPSPASGKIVEIHFSVGDILSQGASFITLDLEASADTPSEPTAPAVEAIPVQVPEKNIEPVAPPTHTDSVTSRTTFPLPDLGVEQAEVSEIMVSVGDMIAENDDVVLLESDKASMEVPSPASGKIVEIHFSVGDMLNKGANFITLETASVNTTVASSAPAPQAVADPVVQPTTPQSVANNTVATASTTDSNDKKADQTKVYAGPAVRKLCRQLGVDISQISGTAVNSRIVKDDVHAFVKQQMQQPKVAPIAQPSSAMQSILPPLPNMSGKEWGATHTQDLSKLQKVSIPQLCYNTQIPQVTQFDLADITDTEAYRGSIKGKLKQQGIGLTIVAFVIKAVAYALKKHPIFNSHLSDDHTHLVMRDEVHIGMAVATDHGLIVPVVRHADQKGLVDIAKEVSEVAGKARDKKLSMSDMTGAGFTISSQGNMGGTYFTPLVNVPQVAILGVSEATIQPRWNAQTNSFEPRLMLPLSLSYDHRVINGADAAVFTRYLATLLADVREVLL